jgi:hypothetical protein
MYFMNSGHVEVVSSDGKTVFATLLKGRKFPAFQKHLHEIAAERQAGKKPK